MTKHGRSHSSAGAPLAIIVATTSCGGGTCPTVYRTATGSYVVQGRAVSPESVGLETPAGEALVEIPASLVESLRDGGRRVA